MEDLGWVKRVRVQRGEKGGGLWGNGYGWEKRGRVKGGEMVKG